MEVVQINVSVVHIPFFGIDIPASSQCIGFSSESSWTEADDQVELAEELQPMGLLPSQEFGGGEVFEVLVVGNDIDGGARTFQIVTPGVEHIVNGEQFLVMGVVVEFRCGQCS